MKNKNDFEYNYVAPTTEERKEIESIRNSYIEKPKSEGKLARLRKLDAMVKNIPTAISIAVGVIGLLLFGLGFSMVLEWKLLVWGIIVSVIGVVPIALAYPINLKVIKILKNKYSNEIIQLSEELLNDEK